VGRAVANKENDDRERQSRDREIVLKVDFLQHKEYPLQSEMISETAG